jgi:hypothetical protein
MVEPAEVTEEVSYTSTVARGAAGELLASAHLMGLGYHVFRALAASCPCDLIAYKEGEVLRVEVKSIRYAPTYRYNPVFPKPTNEDWDVLAVVTNGIHVSLIPYAAGFDELKDAYFAALLKVGVIRKFPERPTIRKIRAIQATQGADGGI